MPTVDVELKPGCSVTINVNAVVGGGGGGGGASALDDLTDVDVSTNAPREGQSLVYDGTEWANNYPPLLFVNYLWGHAEVPVTTVFGDTPDVALATSGLDAVWWLQDEPDPADNGLWVTTASPATATQIAPQPGGIGASMFTYLKWNGSGFDASNITWVNTGGGTAADHTQWFAIPEQALNVLYTKTTPGDWNDPSDFDVQFALDELAARIKALEP